MKPDFNYEDCDVSDQSVVIVIITTPNLARRYLTEDSSNTASGTETEAHVGNIQDSEIQIVLSRSLKSVLPTNRLTIVYIRSLPYASHMLHILSPTPHSPKLDRHTPKCTLGIRHKNQGSGTCHNSIRSQVISELGNKSPCQ